ncbi:MAG TPA: HAD family hydrolase [Bacilli bacterium]|nr:HAD family hydrolase [Bacilli bacterium]HQA56013.1 HAD family hydrolase [Bacilli bacterium]
MKKLIIFDLDGTLLDTLDDLKNAVNYALMSKKWPIKSREEVRLAIGNGVAKLIERTIPKDVQKDEYLSTLEVFKKYYSEHYDIETKPYPGLLPMLRQLKKSGMALAVCTNKTQSIANMLVDKFFPSVFDYVQGDEAGLPKKPEPHMVSKVLDFFSLDNTQAIYVGDTDVDQMTALNSHLDFSLVGYGYRTKKELAYLCPDSKVLAGAEELLTWLLEQKNRS